MVFFNLNEASKITGFSKSTLYKFTSKNAVSFYKPFGKKIFFSEEQLQNMMTRREILSKEELNSTLPNPKNLKK